MHVTFQFDVLSGKQARATTIETMLASREIHPCESKRKLRKPHTDSTGDDSGSQIDEESRKELMRRGPVGRRCAVVALPADVLAAIAEIAELRW
jgi:hypothetical protein